MLSGWTISHASNNKGESIPRRPRHEARAARLWLHPELQPPMDRYGPWLPPTAKPG
jgi:hypothetical protein